MTNRFARRRAIAGTLILAAYVGAQWVLAASAPGLAFVVQMIAPLLAVALWVRLREFRNVNRIAARRRAMRALSSAVERSAA